MKLLIILCLGTLVLCAPAPQEKRKIDFLWQTNQDDETPASVQTVESSTVEPKVTATKITDPRKPAPVYEEEEEEEVADVQEEPREPSPEASPLNTKPEDDSVSNDTSELNSEHNSEQNQENEDQEKSNEEGTTEGTMIDTTIRVYDEDDKETPVEEEKKTETDQDPQQDEEQKQQEETKYAQEQQTEHSDSYQYDDESLEQQLRLQEQATTTVVPVTSSEESVTDIGYDIKVKGGTLVVDKDTYENLNRGKPDLPNWQFGFHGFHGPHDYFGPHHHRNEDSSEEDQGPPHRYHGSPDHPGTFGGDFHGPPPHGLPPHGPPPHGHPFDGPPPPWVQAHRFHHHGHTHDHSKYHLKGRGGPKGYPFHENGFVRGEVPWASKKGTLSLEERPLTEVNNLSL